MANIIGTAENNLLDGDLNTTNIIDGLAGNDTINGGFAADTLNGGEGNDQINSNGLNDLINGDAGNDRLIFSGLNSIINGGLGNDIFDLQGGNDSSIVARAFVDANMGIDTVSDFTTGQDTIELSLPTFPIDSSRVSLGY